MERETDIQSETADESSAEFTDESIEDEAARQAVIDKIYQETEPGEERKSRLIEAAKTGQISIYDPKKFDQETREPGDGKNKLDTYA